MQRKLALLALCLGLGVATAMAQKSKDATIADPDVHHVVLENDHVRVFEAHAAAGRKTPMHTHPPMVIVSIDSARLKVSTPDGKTEILDLRPGTVLWVNGTEHFWELLAGNLHLVAVEAKSAQAASGK